MVTQETFDIVKEQFKLQGSWAIWGDFGSRPRDNMDDLISIQIRAWAWD